MRYVQAKEAAEIFDVSIGIDPRISGKGLRLSESLPELKYGLPLSLESG
jgi:hypothetical protein